MKLTKELKDKIDKYFKSITPIELYKELTEKYHLKDEKSD